MTPPSEEVLREEIAVDVLLWCNEYALALHEQTEMAAAAAVNLMGKHLAKRILEARTWHQSSSPPYSF